MSNPPVRDVIKANNKYKQAYLDMFALIFVWNTQLDLQNHVQKYSNVKNEIKKTIDILNQTENTNEHYQLGTPFPDDETIMGELKSKVEELYNGQFKMDGWKLTPHVTKDLKLDKIAEITALMYLRLQVQGENNNIKPYTELARCIIDTDKANLEYVDPFDGSTYLLQLLSKPDILQKLILDVIRTGKSNPGQVNKDKKTALILACEKNNIEIMEELLKQKNLDPFYQYKYKVFDRYFQNSLEICLNEKKDPKFVPIKDKLNQMKINQVEMVTRAKRLPPDMTGEIVGYIHPGIKYQPPSNNSSNKGGRTRRKRNKSRKRKHNTSRKRKRNTSRKRKHRK